MKLVITQGKSTVTVVLSSSPCRVSSVFNFLPLWMRPFSHLTSCCSNLQITLPLRHINDYLPYGESPLGFINDCISLALGDSVIKRYDSAY